MQNILSIIRQYKIADEICANEYENCSAQIRGLLKTAIAFHFSESVYPKKLRTIHGTFFFRILPRI